MGILYNYLPNKTDHTSNNGLVLNYLVSQANWETILSFWDGLFSGVNCYFRYAIKLYHFFMSPWCPIFGVQKKATTTTTWSSFTSHSAAWRAWEHCEYSVLMRPPISGPSNTPGTPKLRSLPPPGGTSQLRWKHLVIKPPFGLGTTPGFGDVLSIVTNFLVTTLELRILVCWRTFFYMRRPH